MSADLKVEGSSGWNDRRSRKGASLDIDPDIGMSSSRRAQDIVQSRRCTTGIASEKNQSGPGLLITAEDCYVLTRGRFSDGAGDEDPL